ncbi:hypothetical protein F0562_034284 [Nyssa sinensis]|uniref:Poor homologous synapsis 1 PH domain-containing protein n=1 Tax=Nyssa sinensis TaxID=561372 RepID=A0A5J5AIR3_9ASTE|nr:hypothetical protein F0562_034284 [Nyssa sinensis]
MAGSLVPIASEQLEKSVTAITDQWEVQYSRFFNYPSLSSTCPSLTPLPGARRDRLRGNWISSSGPTASLKLLADHSNSEFILIVALREKINEKHYVSKLHFSWPQVSCVSGFPARGSRAVFVSYKDCIQKFALRFLTIYGTERFMNALKEILEDKTVTGLPSGGFGSEISSQSEFVPSSGPLYRATEDWSLMASSDTCTHQMPSTLKDEVAKNSNLQETIFNSEAEPIFSVFPPSFTSLLTNCCPELKQVTAQTTVPEENDLKSQIMRYMDDSSFQDMLTKIEKVISEMGDELML